MIPGSTKTLPPFTLQGRPVVGPALRWPSGTWPRSACARLICHAWLTDPYSPFGMRDDITSEQCTTAQLKYKAVRTEEAA